MSNYVFTPTDTTYNDDNLGGTITGNALSNSINGNVGVETINAGAGNDTVYGGDNGDFLYGEGDDDFLYGDAGNDLLDGGTGADHLYGGGNVDNLYGGAGVYNDYLDGGLNNDFMYGGDGDDTFVDYQGADTAQGGNGDDIFQNIGFPVGAGGGTTTMTGGAGRDRYEMWAYNQVNDIPNITAEIITDFTAGAGGDILHLQNVFSYLSGWDSTTNPFTTNYMRLFQSGANTLVQIDADAGGGVHIFRTVAQLNNVTATALTVDNFYEGYSANGIGIIENLTDDADTNFYGTNSNDTINALGDDDQFFGVNGDDLLRGYSGNDVAYGGYGNDTIYGGTENDGLYGDQGNDTLYGEFGNDALAGFLGNDSLYGGADADTLDDYFGTNTQDGGSGNDIFKSVSYGESGLGGVDTFTGGPGRDTWEVWGSNARYDLPNLIIDVVTDFDPGSNSDMLHLANVFNYFDGWNGTDNPFSQNFIRLNQSGANTLLQVDMNGDAGGTAFTTILQLNNVVVTDFNVSNFVEGFSYNDVGLTIGGTSAADTRTGTNSQDTLSGGAQGDTFYAGNGADTLYGGSGNDYFDAGYGADTVYGGSEDDTLYGGHGIDTLYGEFGNDFLDGDLGNDLLYGGDDVDTLHDTDGANTLDGGNGNDILYGLGYGTATAGIDTITGGGGRDQLRPDGYNIAGDPGNLLADIVTDFTAGAGGDFLDFVDATDDLIGWDGVTNPFTQGFFALTQSGANLLVQVDPDGTAGGTYSLTTLLTLNNVTLANMTVDNNWQGYSHNDVGLTLNGTNVGETINGSNSQDTISGGGGGDSLYGFVGNDTLNGNSGADYLYGGESNDSLNGGSEVDYLYGGNGIDILDGGTGGDNLYGDAHNDYLVGGAGKDNLYGGADSDHLTGGLNQDQLYGGGADGAADLFIFTSVSDSLPSLAQFDTIHDFEDGFDKLDLSAIDAQTTAGGDQAFTFIANAAYTLGVEGQLRRYVINAGTQVVVEGDVNGDAVRDFYILFNTGVNLTPGGGDFVF